MFLVLLLTAAVLAPVIYMLTSGWTVQKRVLFVVVAVALVWAVEIAIIISVTGRPLFG